MDPITLLAHVNVGHLLPPELKDDGSFAGNAYYDMRDKDAVLVLLSAGTVFDADLGSTAETAPPYLEECDTTDGTYAKITDSDLDAVLAGDDDATKIVGWFIDRRKTRKGFLRLNAPHSGNGTTGCVASAIAIGLPQIPPVSATAMGLKEFVQV